MTQPNANQVLQISWAQLITIIMSVVTAAIIQWVAISNRLAVVENTNINQDAQIIEIKRMEGENKKEVINKLDKIQSEVTGIRVELERKQNRP